MKKYIIILLFTVSLFPALQAQKQTYNWTFGYGVGLTWNTTQDVAVTGLFGTPATTLIGLPTSFTSSIRTLEGCFSLSDGNGNLLFYSDGVSIWNKNNLVMPNGSGLSGAQSSTQSGLILPYPGNKDQYLAVTVSDYDYNRFTYSVVDMTLNGGLGDIVAGQKNIPFVGAQGVVGESVTSVRHPNGKDYWILAMGRQKTGPSYINAWLFTSSGGVSSTPVVTSFPYGVDPYNASGYFKISPDGNHFVWSTFTPDNRFFYGDFNSTTAVFSNIKVKTGFDQPYGVEFSPDQELVYLSTKTGLYVYVADELFTASDPSTVTQKLYPLTDTQTSALQQGPDKRIYWILASSPTSSNTSIRVIDNPNDFNNLRIYQTSTTGFFASGTYTGVGLPSFSASWFTVEAIEKSFLCVGNSSKFTVILDMGGSASDLPVRLEWDFGDGSPIVQQTIVAGTSVYTQSHAYAVAGKYTVTVTPYNVNNTALPTVTLPANVVDCVFQTNRMIRVDLLNTVQQKKD